MAIKIQYNKTSQQQIEKQLKIRKKALPTLKSKESALRLEVLKAKDKMEKFEDELNEMKKKYDPIISLWAEFPYDLLKVKEVKYHLKKIAGVDTPELQEVIYDIKDFSLFLNPAWFTDGIAILKEMMELAIQRDFLKSKMEILNYARKKTTQKVNLYEKVQIPGFEDAIRKIKRFLEDEENLSKSAQKIVKSRQQSEAA